MRTISTMLILSLLALPVAHADATGRPGWKLVWSDEFDGDGPIDRSKWNFDTGGGGWGNHEYQHYTDRVENVRRENGKLVIEAHRENYQGDTFTSARVKTKGGWQYGRVEVRAKMPGGVGTWPAIWMMPVKPKHSDVEWPDNGELDILEHVGRDPEKIMSCFYTKNFNWIINTGKIKVEELKTATTQYHVYGFEWDENEAAYYIDGRKWHSFPNPRTSYEDWPFDQAYYLILNMAMGGFGGDVDPELQSAKYQIDYVRVYQKAE